MSIEDNLKKLSPNELIVLKMRCEGKKIEAIALELNYSVEWVWGEMGKVYKKLEFDKKMHWKQRVKILDEQVCPLLSKVPEIPSAVVLVPGPETHPDSEMVALVKLDESQILKQEEEIIPVGSKVISIRDEKRGRPWLAIALISVCFLGIVALSVLGYFYYPVALALMTQQVPQQVIITALVSMTPPPSSTLPTQSLTPTSEASTDTPLPSTDTLVPPTPTAFMPPPDGILFQDNFDNGLNSDWKLDNAWIIADGALSRTFKNTGSYSWATLDEPAWKNYILSVKINIPFMGSAAQRPVAIAVRVNGQAKYLGVQIRAFVGNALYFIGNDENDSQAVAQSRVFDFDSGSTLEIEANGNNFIVRINGRQVQQVSLTDYDSGGIALGMICSNGTGCPSFDDVKVTYLP